MSLLASLLCDVAEDDRDHLLTLIRTGIAADLDAVASGDNPRRPVDVGTRQRRSRHDSIPAPRPA